MAVALGSQLPRAATRRAEVERASTHVRLLRDDVRKALRQSRV